MSDLAMESIRDAVLKCLFEFADNDDQLIVELHRIIAKEGSQSYPVILHVLTHLELSPEKAQNCWRQIIAHRETMSRSLGRPVNFRTAICDYFCSINKSLRNPKVIEIHIFEKTAKSSKYDGLTGLYSRNFLDEALTIEITRAKRHGTELAVMFFDLDGFKKVNDSFGHLAGDAVLKDVAKIILTETRAEDIAARYGGEEIVVVLPETGKVKALIYGERIREKVERMPFEYDRQAIHMTLSGGLASFPIDALDGSSLLKCSDKALYSAKESGKNKIALYSQDKRRSTRLALTAEIKVRAIGFGNARDFTAQSKNISVAGILFESDSPLDIGMKVQLQIPLNNLEVPLLIIGNVVRAIRLDTGRYDVSVSFLEVGKTKANEISRYLVQQTE